MVILKYGFTNLVVILSALFYFSSCGGGGEQGNSSTSYLNSILDLGNGVKADVSALIEAGGKVSLVSIPYPDTRDIVKLTPKGLFIQIPNKSVTPTITGNKVISQDQKSNSLQMIIINLPQKLKNIDKKYITVFVENNNRLQMVPFFLRKNKLYFRAIKSGKYYFTYFFKKLSIEKESSIDSPCYGQYTAGICIVPNQNFTYCNDINIFFKNMFASCQKVALSLSGTDIDLKDCSKQNNWLTLHFKSECDSSLPLGNILNFSINIKLDGWPFINSYLDFSLPIKKHQVVDYSDLLNQYAPIVEFGAFNFINTDESTNDIGMYKDLKDIYDEYYYEMYYPVIFDKILAETNSHLEVYSDIPYCEMSCFMKFPSMNIEDFERRYLCCVQCIRELNYSINVNSLGNLGKDFSYMILANSLQQDHNNSLCNNSLMSCLDRNSYTYDSIKSYATWTEDDDYIYLQYWFYYMYDPKNPGEKVAHFLGRHYGDMERVTIILDRNSQQPLYVFFAHHNDDQKFEYSTPDGFPILQWNKKGFGNEINGVGGVLVPWKSVIKENNRPVIFVALGSHGMYPRRGFYKVDIPVYDMKKSNLDSDLFEFAGATDPDFIQQCTNQNIGLEKCRIDFQNRLEIIKDVSQWETWEKANDYKYLLFSGDVAFNERILVKHKVKFFTMTQSYVNPSIKDGKEIDNCSNGDVCRIFPWLTATLGNRNDDEAFFVTFDGNMIFTEDDYHKGGFIVSGYTTISGERKALITKFTLDGKLQKSIILNGNYNGYLRVKKSKDGGYVGYGVMNSKNLEDKDAWIVKFDKDLNIEWQKRFLIDYSFDQIHDLIEVDENKYFAILYSEVGIIGASDILLVELDAQGNVIRAKAFGTVNYDGGISINTDDKNLIISGYISSQELNSGTSTGVIMRLNMDNLIPDWVIRVDSGKDDFIKIVKISNGYLAIGYIDGDGYNTKAFVMKIDRDGNVEWAKYLDRNYTIFKSAVETNQGDYILIGREGMPGSKDVIMIRIDSKGTLKDAKKIRGSGDEDLYSIVPLGENKYYEFLAVGSTSSIGSGNLDYLMIRFDEGLDYIYDLGTGEKANDYVPNFRDGSNFVYSDGDATGIESEDLNITILDTNFSVDSLNIELIEDYPK